MRARCAVFAFVIAALSPCLLAQTATSPRAVEDTLPASSYGCFRFGGLADYRKAVDQMPAAELVKGVYEKLPPATVERHVNRGLDMAAGHVRGFASQLGVRPAALRAVLQRPMALGIGRLTLRGYGPSAALLIDVGPARNDLAEVITALEQQAQRHAKAKGGRETVAGIPVQYLEPHDGPKILYGFLGDLYFVTNSSGYLAEIAAVAQGKAPGLGAAPALQGPRQRLPMPALAAAFLNLRPFRSMLDPVLPYEAAEIGALLGIDGCDGIYWGTSGAQSGAADVLHFGMTGPTQGLLKTAFKGPVSLTAARYCSPDAVAFAAGSLDIPAVIDAFSRCLDALPESIRQEIRRDMGREMGRGLRQFGLTAEALDGMLRAFGSNVALGVDLAKGTPAPEFLLFVEVKDMATVTQLMARLEQAVAAQMQGEWKVRKVGNREIRYCNIPVPIVTSPCWIHDGGMLIFGSNVKALMSALQRVDKGEPSLLAAPDFVALAANCKDASAVSHLRLQTGAELGWKAAEPWLRALIDSNETMLGFSGDVVPDAAQVARAAGTTTLSLHVDGQGVLIRQSGTLALGALFATAGRLADEVLERASAKAF